jgi:hypothetical protein
MVILMSFYMTSTNDENGEDDVNKNGYLLIGDFDVLIASTAITHDVTLVSGNERHFKRIIDSARAVRLRKFYGHLSPIVKKCLLQTLKIRREKSCEHVVHDVIPDASKRTGSLIQGNKTTNVKTVLDSLC